MYLFLQLFVITQNTRELNKFPLFDNDKPCEKFLQTASYIQQQLNHDETIFGLFQIFNFFDFFFDSKWNNQLTWLFLIKARKLIKLTTIL